MITTAFDDNMWPDPEHPGDAAFLARRGSSPPPVRRHELRWCPRTARELNASKGLPSAFIARFRTTARILDITSCICHNADMTKQREMRLSDQVRQAIAESGLTRYRIAQDTGIDESALAKFFNGQRGLSMDALDRLGEYLGLRIVTDRNRRTEGR
jgi:hypothetical protein